MFVFLRYHLAKGLDHQIKVINFITETVLERLENLVELVAGHF